MVNINKTMAQPLKESGDQGQGRCDGTGVCDETVSDLQQKESSLKKHTPHAT